MAKGHTLCCINTATCGVPPREASPEPLLRSPLPATPSLDSPSPTYLCFIIFCHVSPLLSWRLSLVEGRGNAPEYVVLAFSRGGGLRWTATSAAVHSSIPCWIQPSVELPKAKWVTAAAPFLRLKWEGVEGAALPLTEGTVPNLGAAMSPFLPLWLWQEVTKVSHYLQGSFSDTSQIGFSQVPLLLLPLFSVGKGGREREPQAGEKTK